MKLCNIIIGITLIALTGIRAGAEQSIVPKDIEENVEFKLAANFLNRYADLLRSIQDKETTDALRRAKENGLKYLSGNDKAMKSLSGNEDFSINLNNSTYTARWSKNGNNLVTCTFPANIVLLTFSNKIGLENKLYQDLSHASASDFSHSILSRPKSELQPIEYSDLYISDRDYFVTPSLSNQIVYKPQLGSEMCEMLVDTEKYPVETLSNIMLSGHTSHDLLMNVALSKYGYKNESVSLPFKALYHLFSEEGSTPYWGIDTYDGTTVNGVYVWINKYGGYAHVMTVQLPISAISNDEEAKVRLHGYVRLDNLKSMFEEYSTK